MTQLKCPKCGKENPVDANFCENCGFNLKAAPPKKKSNKIIIVIIIALAVVIIAAAVAIITNQSKKKDNDEIDTELLEKVLSSEFDVDAAWSEIEENMDIEDETETETGDDFVLSLMDGTHDYITRDEIVEQMGEPEKTADMSHLVSNATGDYYDVKFLGYDGTLCLVYIENSMKNNEKYLNKYEWTPKEELHNVVKFENKIIKHFSEMYGDPVSPPDNGEFDEKYSYSWEKENSTFRLKTNHDINSLLLEYSK